ncbi:type I-C CRISPR-associated protein Cas8c/Csd1 [Nocardia callitridis]|uniref:Type I-C CRISPR-associated protein Cas8c/Csd1 n=1 Tax=Nocardia callitridis TaxID=648753 RepID=A0ABP9KHG5_9NOCA
MLLERLASYAAEHRDGVPAFHRERSFRWKLDLTAAEGIVTDATLQEPRDEQNPKRGVTHTVPVSTRAVDISPNLAADDVQYVLGWGDETTKSTRVASCHDAFVELIRDWAAAVSAEEDPVPHILAEAFRSTAWSKLTRPEEMKAKDGVVIAINGRYAYASSTASGFWQTRVELKKGSGRSGVCMVCKRVALLANTIPGKVAASLVPGAGNDVALVSINERVFGYDLAEQLTHAPVCLVCADDVMVGLTGVLSSDHSLTSSGQDTRLVWWVADTEESDHMDLVFDPEPAEVDALFQSIHRAEERRSRLEGKFCWLAVGANVSRVMVREWVDIALTSKDHNVVNHDTNVLAWFSDHKNTPRRTQPVELRDGGEIPAGKWCHSPTALAACLGRWDSGTSRYRPFGAKNADRPDQALHQLLRVAVLNEPVPVAMRAHLMHRIRNDGHVDDRRASLVRLALNRCPNRPKEAETPMSLDETCTNPAYVAGRLFAVMEDVQRSAHRRATSGEDPGDEAPRSEVNSTFGDRFFRRAVDTPRPVLVQGRQDAGAWLTKIRRRDNSQLANWHKNRLDSLYALLEQSTGIPLRNNLRQKEQFVLGYHHQRAHRPAKTGTAAAQA